MQIIKFVVFIVACKFYFSVVVRCNPIAGLTDPSCFVASGDCPNENVTFWLYTNATRDAPVLLDPLNLNPWAFQPRRPLKILIHGYTGHRDYAPNSFIRPVLLDYEDVYVISADYGPLVRLPCYFAAVENLALASKCLGQLINNLVDQQIVHNEDIHIIGFSLGAQMAGQTANHVKRRLKRITGLDPAKPMFITADSSHKLDASDAEFVDVIHTDVLGRGMLRALGHADFYPNIGAYQPGCRKDNAEDPGSCNHDRAPRYYAESIKNEKAFWSYSCGSWLHYVFDLCDANTNDAIMGYFVNQTAKGSYFLSTSHKSPFALGPIIPAIHTKIHNNTLHFNNISILYDERFEKLLQQAYLAIDDYDLDDESKHDVAAVDAHEKNVTRRARSDFRHITL